MMRTCGDRERQGRRPMLAMIALVLAGAIGWSAVSALAQQTGPRPPMAIAAHNVSVHESLRSSEVISHKGNSSVKERARGTGTFVCPAVLEVIISYTNGNINLVCMTKAGDVSGGGKLSYFTAGPTATFTGTLAIARGTGKYVHARGRLHVEGSMVRKTFSLAATVTGPMSY
jgi:hypothetical protein